MTTVTIDVHPTRINAHITTDRYDPDVRERIYTRHGARWAGKYYTVAARFAKDLALELTDAGHNVLFIRSREAS